MNYLEVFAFLLVICLLVFYIKEMTLIADNRSVLYWVMVIGFVPVIFSLIFFLAALDVWQSDPYEKHKWKAQQQAFEKCKQSPSCVEKVLQLTK